MVKVIVTGATGLVGDALLRYCILRKDITSIIVFTRRELVADLQNNAKVTIIIHKDFKSYPSDLLKRLDGAVACLWALGLRGALFGYPDPRYAEEVDFEYPLAAAKAFQQQFGRSGRTRSGSGDVSTTFRFVLCSGIGAEMDQTQPLWILRDTRLLKGRIESALRDLSGQDSPTPPKAFEVYTVRPGGILAVPPPFVRTVLYSYLRVMPSLTTTELAAAMLDLGLNGDQKWIWENDEIVRRGREVMSRD